mgnify:FL=1
MIYVNQLVVITFLLFLDKKRNDAYHFLSFILFQFLPIQQQCILFYLEFLVVALEC